MVKVREDHPLLHDGSLDVQGWIESIRQAYDIKDTTTIEKAVLLAKKIADDAVLNRTYWSVDSVQMGLEMAQILLDLRLDTESIVAAILYRADRKSTRLNSSHVRI